MAVALPSTAIQARRWRLGGRVQGVGFRPFVYQLSLRLGVTGYVLNRSGTVEIYGEADAQTLDAFGDALQFNAPALAQPELLAEEACAPAGLEGFEIRHSRAGAADIHVPPDYAPCTQCLHELNDPNDRRFRYPFINCTQCGPRYSIIRSLPYDRPNTSLAGFALCKACRQQYKNPLDRHFHAEPLACPECGPTLSFHGVDGAIIDGNEAALNHCVQALKSGLIVAVKAVGGYHLMVDACNESAVQRLRQRKQRPHKPLAVLFPESGDLAELAAEVQLQDDSRRALVSLDRPIVLLPKHTASKLAASIAPQLAEIGVMLPSSPLQMLLVADFGGPLVATSANLSGEPVLTEATDVEQRLSAVADGFLHHNRPIVRPVDDAVLRPISGALRPLRLGRGNAPLEMQLPFAIPRPVLATGAQMKNTLALAWDKRLVLSPHIGDLQSPRAQKVFAEVSQDLQKLYGVTPEVVVCDAHPGFAGQRWARQSDLPLVKVFHHQAHASALVGEFNLQGTGLVFTWDGLGLGEDGQLWGGEGLYGRPGQWHRVSSLRHLRLPGGDQASRQPWRSAAALCWETQQPWLPPSHLSASDTVLLHQAWQLNLNCHNSSAAGRLFDGTASLLGLIQDSSYDGQAPMLLEAMAVDAAPMQLPLQCDGSGIWRSDWAPLLPQLQNTSLPPEIRAGLLHASLAQVILDQTLCIRSQRPIAWVGLCGGVFQNRRLSEQAIALLTAAGIPAYLPERLPCNDAAIAFGQIIEVAARQTAIRDHTSNQDLTNHIDLTNNHFADSQPDTL